ncbi:nucleoside 2-deoxyribosyltransferase [Burkholderia oklahomensis]|nr:nucleoside 2-deoxyribosyltransferase [Burkholderia oklahomensis]
MNLNRGNAFEIGFAVAVGKRVLASKADRETDGAS